METDVGQTEFTPPGILSLVKVNSPVFGKLVKYSTVMYKEDNFRSCFSNKVFHLGLLLLGPPFTHLAKSERYVVIS